VVDGLPRWSRRALVVAVCGANHVICVVRRYCPTSGPRDHHHTRCRTSVTQSTRRTADTSTRTLRIVRINVTLMSSQRCVTPPDTQYPITVLNVIILSYIIFSVIIKHNNPLRIAVLSRSMYHDLMDSIAYFYGHYCIVYVHYCILLCRLYNLAFWLQFFINVITYLLTYSSWNGTVRIVGERGVRRPYWKSSVIGW